MNEQEIDYLTIQIPIARDYQPTEAELIDLATLAIQKALVTR